MSTDRVTEASLRDFCESIYDDFRHLSHAVRQAKRDWDDNVVAEHLMDLGREQFSKQPEARDMELVFIRQYVATLGFEHPRRAWFTAYAAGAMLGLVQGGHLSPGQLADALEIAAQEAERLVDGV